MRVIIRRLLLCRVLSKDSKVGPRNVYLAAFEYFRPGIMRVDRPIRIKHFRSCARVVDKQYISLSIYHLAVTRVKPLNV